MTLSTTGYITAPIDELLKYGDPTDPGFDREVETRIDRLLDLLEDARSQRDCLADLVSNLYAEVDLWLDLEETKPDEVELALNALEKLRAVRISLGGTETNFKDEEA